MGSKEGKDRSKIRDIVRGRFGFLWGEVDISTEDSDKDELSISKGVYEAFTKLNLRYSQLAPVSTWEEKNTGNNLPAQIEIYSDTDHPDEYNFLFIAKGGGSARWA